MMVKMLPLIDLLKLMEILISTKMFMQAVKFSLALGTSPPFARFDKIVTVGKTRLC